MRRNRKMTRSWPHDGAATAEQKWQQCRHHLEMARCAPLFARLVKCKPSETSSKRASGANMCWSKNNFLATVTIFMTPHAQLGRAWHVDKPHDCRRDNLANGKSQPRASDAEAAFFHDVFFLLVEIIQIQHPCKFIELIFSGAIWSEEIHSGDEYIFLCKPIISVSFHGQTNVNSNAFCFIRCSFSVKFFRVAVNFVLTGAKCTYFR